MQWNVEHGIFLKQLVSQSLIWTEHLEGRKERTNIERKKGRET
jgi:hypothetical protein